MRLYQIDPAREKSYTAADFPTVLLDGLPCDKIPCPLQNIDSGQMAGTFEAAKVFILKWKETYPDYVSPYGVARRLQESVGELGGGSQVIPSVIIV